MRLATDVMTKRVGPVAQLLRPAAAGQKLQFGVDAGQITIRDDFDAPLDDFREYTN